MTSAATSSAATSKACVPCLRRSWLLGELSPPLDYRTGDVTRLFELLALGDSDLVQAIGGRRRDELSAAYEQFVPEPVSDVSQVCCHERRYPNTLGDREGPQMLHVAGSLQRLVRLTSAPVVAISGTQRATDYGLAMAGNLARGLAAAGVTVAGGSGDGIARAAQLAAMEVNAGTILVAADGLDVLARRRPALYERVKSTGCVLAELPGAVSGRRWGALAAARVLAGIAELTIVVEARDSAVELAGARLAQATGRAVAAVPGRVTSPASCGAHALLCDGADLVTGAADVLDLLYAADARVKRRGAAMGPQLDPRLREMLELVGSGRDTPAQLLEGGEDPDAVLQALSELELLGLLVRGQGGRYVPRDPLARRPVR